MRRHEDPRSCWRSGGFRFAPELGPPDLRRFDFLHELGEIAAAGGDIRGHVFGALHEEREAA